MTIRTMPPKKRRVYNISGLRNQPSQTHDDAYDGPIPAPLCSESDVEDFSWSPNLVFDSLKVDIAAETALDDESIIEEEDAVEWDSEWDQDRRLGSEGMQATMLRLAIELGDDPRDEEWVPPKLRANQKFRTKQKQGKRCEFHGIIEGLTHL